MLAQHVAMRAAHVRQVMVGGKTIVANGMATGIDYPAMMREALAQLKAKLDPTDTWRSTVQSLDGAMKPLYLQARHLGCG